MQLTIAERDDFLQIAQQTYPLWSAGLTPADYRYLLWSTRYQPWAKNNNTRWVFKEKNKVVASYRVVRLPFCLKGKHYNLVGLGAIYTAPDWRGQGLATRLIKTVIDKAKKEDVAAVLLLSAIDKDFYAARGFESLGSLDFELDARIYSFSAGPAFAQNSFDLSSTQNISIEIRSTELIRAQDRANKSKGECAKFHFSSFSPWLIDDELMQINRCHTRWLARQPYGIMRNKQYFEFQLAKFLYFSTYSNKNKPVLFLTILKEGSEIKGYALTECGGTSLRILELIGDDLSRAYLWQSLIQQAQKMNLERISGFESGVRDFIPKQQLDQMLINSEPAIKASAIQCYERLWSQPMFLPIKKEMESLSDYNPCPLLEFDYF